MKLLCLAKYMIGKNYIPAEITGYSFTDFIMINFVNLVQLFNLIFS